MTFQEIYEVLNSCNLFHELDSKHKLYITHLFHYESFPDGHILVEEGKLIDYLYIVASGKWEVYLPKESGDLTHTRSEEIHLSVLQSSALIGEYSFVDNNVASASICALSNASFIYISRRNFERILQSSNLVGKMIYKNLLMTLIARLRSQNDEKDLISLLDFP